MQGHRSIQGSRPRAAAASAPCHLRLIWTAHFIVENDMGQILASVVERQNLGCAD